jgi:hypothetical protein
VLAVFGVLAATFISLLITRVASVALTVTGLSRQSARFQARSAFSGVGFTTSEAEDVVNHPVRRRIVMWLMLIGNAGLITIVASTMLSFVGSDSGSSTLVRFAVLVTGFAVLLLLAKSERVDAFMSRWIARMLNRYTDLDARDYARLLHLTKDFGISELLVQTDDWLTGQTLADLRLRDEGLVVLGIHHRNGPYVGVPKGAARVMPGDTLIVYGKASTLKELDERHQGLEGDLAHEQAVDERRRELQPEEVHADA